MNNIDVPLALYDLFLDWLATLPKRKWKIAVDLFCSFVDFVENIEERNNE